MKKNCQSPRFEVAALFALFALSAKSAWTAKLSPRHPLRKILSGWAA
jgi:hypothetical protein